MAGTLLYAADFRLGTIDVFNQNFQSMKLKGNFSDPQIPAGFAPFDIQNIGGKLFVTYAKQDASKHDDVAGAGNGFVDIFNTDGTLFKHLISHGALNSPWGVAIAPSNFGQFSGDLLVGNFGDGHINVFNPVNGTQLGTLHNQFGNPVTIDHLWALKFGNGGAAGATNTLFFTAGIGDEGHGLFGSLRLPDADGDAGVHMSSTSAQSSGGSQALVTAMLPAHQNFVAQSNSGITTSHAQTQQVIGLSPTFTVSATVSQDSTGGLTLHKHEGGSTGLDDFFASDPLSL